jgi:hypothetical protein
MMRSDLAFSLGTGVFLLLVLLTRWRWRRTKTAPAPPRSHRGKRAPQPFAGYTRKPECELCEQAGAFHPQMPGAPPSRMGFPRGRRRDLETTGHFWPHAEWAYHGRVDWGNSRAKGHPNGRRGRQLVCLSCRSDFLETLGTPCHAKQLASDTLVWAIAALAEGLGIRAVARVVETAPNTVLGWLVEAAEHLEACSRCQVHDLPVEPVQMAELFAWLRAVKAGEGTEAEAMKRLSRALYGVWGAMDPVCKLILAVDVGDRIRALAQRLLHQVTQVLAPEGAPLVLTDGCRDYRTALVTHDGQGIQPKRRQGKGRWPTPRGMLQPRRLYAQVVTSSRRRRLVGVTHRIIFGAAATIKAILAKRGWPIKTSFIERLNRDFRQHVAAIGRRVNPLCNHEAGLRQQLAIFHTDHNVVLPHASVRLPRPDATHGLAAGQHWRQQTPAMAAGLPDHIWSLREGLMFRVPPWPPPLV